MSGGYKPRWVVTVTPPGASAVDVSAYVEKISVTTSLAIKSGQFEVDLWDRDGKGFMTFPVGSTVAIYADTLESASSNAATASLAANTPVLVSAKSWGAVSSPPSGLQLRSSLDGTTWGPWSGLTRGNVPECAVARYVEASAACTLSYYALPLVMTGIVTDPVGGHDGPNYVTVDLRGDDWVNIMTNRNVAGKWYVGDGVTDGHPDLIIQQIVTNFFSGELTTNHVQAGAPRVQYEYARRKSAFNVLQDVTNQTGWIWWIDTSKDVHFAPPSSQPAHPVALDIATTIVRGTMRGPEYDGRKLVNRVMFWGGSNTAPAPFSDSFIGDGTRRTYFTTYALPGTAPTVAVNGTVQTIALDNGTQAAQWYYQVGQNYLRQDPGQTVLGAADVLTVTYSYGIPFIRQMQDDASIAAYGVFEQDIVDQTVSTAAIATQRMKALLDAWSRPVLRLQLDSWETSYTPGQQVVVNDAALGLVGTVVSVLECHHQITPEEYQLTLTLGTVQGGDIQAP